MKLTNSYTLSRSLINRDMKPVKSYPMKNFLLLFSMIACCFSAYSQTISLSTTATTVASGTVITVKVVGETPSKYIFGINYMGVSANPYSSLLTGAVAGNATFYNRATGVPTSFPLRVSNTTSGPATVTYNFQLTPYDYINLTSLPPVNASVTVVVNQAPPPNTDLGYDMTLTTAGDYTNFTITNFAIFKYVQGSVDGYGFLWEYSTTPDFKTFKTIDKSNTPNWSISSQDLLPYDPFHPRPASDYYLTQTTYFREKVTFGGKFSYSNVVSIVR
jgi:hypothetical protein